VILNVNEIFGRNGWSTSIKEVHVDFQDEIEGIFHCGCHAIVKITLKDGTFHEDVGYGISKDKTLSNALERAKKIAVTDGIKRSVKQFGNHVGLCIYNHKYMEQVKEQMDDKNPFPTTSIKRKQPEEEPIFPNKSSNTDLGGE